VAGIIERDQGINLKLDGKHAGQNVMHVLAHQQEAADVGEQMDSKPASMPDISEFKSNSIHSW
jgi:hypothetical protein